MKVRSHPNYPVWLRLLWFCAGIFMFFQAVDAFFDLANTPQQVALSKPCQFKSAGDFTYGVSVKSYLSPSEEAQIGPVEYVIKENGLPIQRLRVETLTATAIEFPAKREKTYSIEANFPGIKDRNDLSNADLYLQIDSGQRVRFNSFYYLVKWGGIIMICMGLGMGVVPPFRRAER